MYCKKCGAEIVDESKFCPKCGAPQTKTGEVVQEAQETVKNTEEKITKGVEDLNARTEEKLTDIQKETTEKIDKGVADLNARTEEKLNNIQEDVHEAIEDADKREAAEVKGQGGNYQANLDNGGQITDSLMDILLKIVAVVVILYFALQVFVGIGNVFHTIGNLFSLLRYRFSLFTLFSFLIALILDVLPILAHLFVIVGAFALGFKRTDSQTTELLTAFGLTAALELIVCLVRWIFLYHFYAFLSAFKTGLWALLAFVVFFGVLFLSGRKTILALDMSDPKVVFADALNAIMDAVLGPQDAREQAKQAKTTNQAPTQQGTYTGVQQPGAIPAGAGVNATAAPAGFYGQRPMANPSQTARPISTSRGLFKYILLNLITCGIYGLFFIHSLAADVNEMCQEDGKKTAGLLPYILLSFITCGIYGIYWDYQVANRLQENGYRYGCPISESGSTVLLWIIVGWLLCLVGPFIAFNIIIKNTNRLAIEYNRVNGFM